MTRFAEVIDSGEIAITTSETVLLAPTKILGSPDWIVFAKNEGGGSADDFTGVKIYTGPAPDNCNADMELSKSVQEQAANTLADGIMQVAYASNNGMFAYVRVSAVSAGDTTARAWLSRGRR